MPEEEEVRKVKTLTKSAYGSVKVQTKIDYQFKGWHRHKVELNTSNSNQSAVLVQINTHYCHSGCSPDSWRARKLQNTQAYPHHSYMPIGQNDSREQ